MHAHVLNKRNSPSSRVILLNFGLFLVLFFFIFVYLRNEKIFETGINYCLSQFCKELATLKGKSHHGLRTFYGAFFVYHVKIVSCKKFQFCFMQKKKNSLPKYVIFENW